MENVFYCEDECRPGCESTGSADRASNDGYAACQNIASRMVQKEALAHAQVCVAVGFVCPRDALISLAGLPPWH